MTYPLCANTPVEAGKTEAKRVDGVLDFLELRCCCLALFNE